MGVVIEVKDEEVDPASSVKCSFPTKRIVVVVEGEPPRPRSLGTRTRAASPNV